MPMSHDAGMSVDNSPTHFANKRVTLTQTKNVAQQLAKGARYFDIRPVLSKGQYFTGHYSDIKPLGWQGGNGQSIADIVKETNKFTAENGELVMFEISHDYNADKDYSAFDQPTWNGLFAEFRQLNRLFTPSPITDTSDLSKLTLNEFIPNKTAAVVVIINLDPGIEIPEQYHNEGIFRKGQFPTTGSYAETDDLRTMIKDQLTKMKTLKKSPDDPVFDMSWTLTQSTEDAILANPSILDLADEANAALYANIIPACSSKSFPNLIEIDNYANGDVAHLCIAINDINVQAWRKEAEDAAAANAAKDGGVTSSSDLAMKGETKMVKRNKTVKKIKRAFDDFAIKAHI